MGGKGVNWERGKGRKGGRGTNTVVEASQAVVTQDMRKRAKHSLWTICGAGLQPDLCSSHCESLFFLCVEPDKMA